MFLSEGIGIWSKAESVHLQEDQLVVIEFGQKIKQRLLPEEVDVFLVQTVCNHAG